MARRRYQAPTPKRVGNRWYVLVWEDAVSSEGRSRKRKRVFVGPADRVSFREAQKSASEILRPTNQAMVVPGSAITFQEFLDRVYRPTVFPLFANSTRSRYESVLRKYLEPAFGTMLLRHMTPLVLQQYLSGLAGLNLADESRDKIRDVLASSLSSAVQFHFLVNNPIEGLKLPRSGNGARRKLYVTPPQFAALVDLIREPFSTMVYVAVHTGLRVSELVGLRWNDIHADSITVDESCVRGVWGAPKSAASCATVAVNLAVIRRLELLKTGAVQVRAGRAVRRYPLLRGDGAEDLVFQSRAGTPVSGSNVLSRHLKPAGRKLGIAWVNWQVLRRSFATWLKMAGADVKDAQGLMRHSRASTTLDIYQQFVPESQRRAVDRLAMLPASMLVQ